MARQQGLISSHKLVGVSVEGGDLGSRLSWLRNLKKVALWASMVLSQRFFCHKVSQGIF